MVEHLWQNQEELTLLGAWCCGQICKIGWPVSMGCIRHLAACQEDFWFLFSCWTSARFSLPQGLWHMQPTGRTRGWSCVQICPEV